MDKSNRIDFSMFVLRLVLGTVFLVNGAQKLFGMFGGMGIERTVKIVEGFGFPEPLFFSVAWGGAEVVSGICLLFGAFSRWAAAVIFMVTIVRMYKVNLVYGAFIQSGFLEYDVLILGACIPLMVIGGGSWSVWDI